MKNRMVLLGGATALVLLLAGCGHKLSPEEKQQLATVTTQLRATQEEVAAAQQTYDRYGEGLLKVLSAARLEILKTNAALLTQRANALESGAKITVLLHATKEDPARAAQLLAEVETERAKLAAAKADAEKYGGGLVQALAQVSVATHENTVALLEQQYLLAKYGFALPTSAPADPPKNP